MVLAAPASRAFSLLGPFKDGANGVADGWQAAGYGGLPGGLGYTLLYDIGGPMFLTEAYRWNVPTITYAFDESFIRYFGTNGMFAVRKAFDILNALPPCTAMSADLTEFPEEGTREVNNTAQALGLHDIKSLVLAAMMEQLGLANPQRFVWGLRSRTVIQGVTNYTVLPMNYDPVTYRWTPYINGVLYAYRVIEPLGPAGQEYASAVEIALGDPTYVDARTPVAARFTNPDELLTDQGIDAPVSFVSELQAGHCLTGLTRDDVGGLRFLLRPDNVVTEGLLTNVIPRNPFLLSPWTPIVGGTNLLQLTNQLGAVTNLTNVVLQALRGGVNKITFQQVNYDSLLGLGFVTITNSYTDNFVTNGVRGWQRVQRIITQPDILFLVEDLGLLQGVPIPFERTGTAGWINNNLLNGRANQNGPGLISPQIQFRFTDSAPFFIKTLDAPFGNHRDVPFAWASFDASTNEPIVYPQFLGYTVHQLGAQVLGRAPGPPFP